jgi:hypothetical protein
MTSRSRSSSNVLVGSMNSLKYYKKCKEISDMIRVVLDLFISRDMLQINGCNILTCDNHVDVPWYTPSMMVRSMLIGLRSVESKESVIGCCIDSRFKAFKGPKTSKAVNAGNNSTAMRNGAV